MNPILDYLLEKKKRDTELSMARSAVEHYVKSVMPKIGLPYKLETYENGMILRIKLKHRRCIQIKMNRQNYVQSIQQLMPVINTLADTLNSIGRMNIHVNGSCSGQWIEPEPQIGDG